MYSQQNPTTDEGGQGPGKGSVMNRMDRIMSGKRAQEEYKLVPHGRHDKETEKEGIDLPARVGPFGAEGEV